MTGRLARLRRLEARRREEGERVPLCDVAAFLLDVLGVVSEEAGPGAADRIAVRAVGTLEGAAVRAGVRL